MEQHTLVHIGFTGTQLGMTMAQGEAIIEILQHRVFYAHHGDCIGADKHFDTLVRQLPGCRGVFIHPCDIHAKRAYCTVGKNDFLRPVMKPLKRNREIVDAVVYMLATPKEMREQWRSGTWSTIRYAKKIHRPMTIILPTGWRLE